MLLCVAAITVSVPAVECFFGERAHCFHFTTFFVLQDVIKLNDPGDKDFVASRDVNNFVHLQVRLGGGWGIVIFVACSPKLEGIFFFSDLFFVVDWYA